MELSSTDKAELYNNSLKQLEDILSDVDKKLGEKDSLSILSSILNDYDLETASNLVKANCEPFILKRCYEDQHFDEGNEEAGFISLKSLLKDVETVLNCDDYTSDIHFTDFIRIETAEEKEESGNDLNVEWFIPDESHSIKDTYIGFEDM